jgi:anti-sigma factor RsiW
MPNCQTIDPLVTPYVDDQLNDADRRLVDDHLRRCSPCHSRINAERAVRDLLQARREELTYGCAPAPLRERCRGLAADGKRPQAQGGGTGWRAAANIRVPPRTRFAPLALAASLVLIVGVAFLYQLTAASSKVLAAELAADHVKCFTLNDVLHTHQQAGAVESYMLSGFGWRMQLPSGAANESLELVGSRPCLYGEGKIAHIMYRHRGQPVSLFMLPRASRTQDFVEVFGHKAAIWCDGERTFVLLAREPKEEVERMAAAVQATMR